MADARRPACLYLAAATAPFMGNVARWGNCSQPPTNFVSPAGPLVGGGRERPLMGCWGGSCERRLRDRLTKGSLPEKKNIVRDAFRNLLHLDTFFLTRKNESA